MSRTIWSGTVAAACMFAVSGAIRAPADGIRPPGPDPPAYIEDALTPFRAPPDSSEVAELLERWRRDDGLDDAHDRILGARLWRRAGRLGAALTLLGPLPDAGLDAALARLERARVGMELGDRRHAVRRAPGDWRAACRRLAALPDGAARDLRDELWHDLEILATPEEHEAWGALEHREACPWLEGLIEERAFRMAISPDERLALHYRRLETARRHFYLERPRFYVGMTHWHGRREGSWMDDRGLVYVRMGPPDESHGCGAVHGFDDDPLEGDLLATCWVYHRPEGYKLYFFSTRDKVTGRVSADGDYYLQESLGPRAHPGDPYFQRYVKNADVPRSLVRHLSFSRRLLIQGDNLDAGLDRAEDQAYRHQMRVATRRFADEALVAIPDVPRVTGADMLWEALRFFNPTDESWQVWIVASVPAGQLQPARGHDTWAYEARARLAARHRGGVRIDSTFNRAVVADELPPEAGLPLRMFVVAGPGPLPITLAVSDGTRPGMGAWAQDTVHVPRALPVPTVSDIAVAQAEGGTWTRDGETFLRVSPDHVTNSDGEIHIYFEVYGVRRTADYDIQIRLTRSGAAREAEDAFRLDPAELPFRLDFTGSMPYGRIGRHGLRLDLSGTAPGAYDLAVRARDAGTDTRGLPSVTPIIVTE